ncbi:MAG: CS domain-containing protein [Candidatus Thermoplasmatota archaeon]
MTIKYGNNGETTSLNTLSEKKLYEIIEEVRNKLSDIDSAQNKIKANYDIIETDREINLTMNLPEPNKQDIDIKTTESSIKIVIFTPKKILKENIELPLKIKPKETKATYKNGVLDLSLKRKNKK